MARLLFYFARGSTFHHFFEGMAEMDPSNIQESKLATVHGIFVGDVSPIKVSRKCADRKYFEANLSDGNKTLQVFPIPSEPVLLLLHRRHSSVSIQHVHHHHFKLHMSRQ